MFFLILATWRLVE